MGNARTDGGTRSDLLEWIQQIPFKRVAVWLFVGFFAHQLKDFFGVRLVSSCNI